MPMHEALVARLKADATVAALAVNRVEWFERPRKDALPAVTLTIASPGVEWTLTDVDALEQPRVQFDAWAMNKTDVGALARAIRAEMERTDEVTVGDTRFLPPGVLEMEFMDKEAVAGTDGVFRWTQDFSFFHQPA